MANSASSSQEREAPGVDPVVAALGRRVQDLEERAEHDKAEILMIKAEHIRQMAKYEQPKQKQDKKYRTLICPKGLKLYHGHFPKTFTESDLSK